MKALFAAGKKGRSGSPQLPNEGSVEDDDDIGVVGSGSQITLFSVMTPPSALYAIKNPTADLSRYQLRVITEPVRRPKKPYKRVYKVTTVGRDNLEREILSDPDDPDLNIVFTLGMSFIRGKFGGSVTRAGLLLLEWAFLRGLDFTYREKRVIAAAHWDCWQLQGLAGEVFHLKRSRELYEQILELPEFGHDISVWLE